MFTFEIPKTYFTMLKHLIVITLLFGSCASLTPSDDIIHLSKSPSIITKGYTVVYSAKDNALQLRRYLFPEEEIQLDPKEKKQLKALLLSIDLSSTKASYGRENVRDVPVTEIHLLTKKQKTSIHGYNAAPPPLKKILHEINALILH